MPALVIGIVVTGLVQLYHGAGENIPVLVLHYLTQAYGSLQNQKPII